MHSSFVPSLILIITMFTLPCAAKEKPAAKRAPLPQTILRAKTVCIYNQTGFAKVADDAYDELKKWGRFTVVEVEAGADLAFAFSKDPRDPAYLMLVVIDPAKNNGEAIWSDSKEEGHSWREGALITHGSAARKLIKDLRDRVKEQEGASPPR